MASGRLAKKSETSKRLEEDSYAKLKYDKTKESDLKIIERVIELAERKNVSMTEIALAWQLTKVASPIAGVTKKSQIDALAKSVDLTLSEEEIVYLEELYVPHSLVGVIAQNTRKTANEVKVWTQK